MESGLGQLVRWCVEALAPEAESAARWAEACESDAARRAQRMLADLSSRVVAAGQPRHFVDAFPGVRGSLTREAAYVVFRMVKIHLYVAAAGGRSLDEAEEASAQSLLLLALALGIPEVDRVASEAAPARKLLERAFPGGRPEAEARLEREVNDRVARVASYRFAGAVVGAFEFLALAAAADLAAAWYDDLRLSAADLEALRRRSAERASAVLGLLRLTARADGSVSSAERGVLEAVRAAVPTFDPEAVPREAPPAERLPEILPYAEERQGLFECMLAVASADGRLAPDEAGLCREVAERLEIPPEAVERSLERVNRPPPT